MYTQPSPEEGQGPVQRSNLAIVNSLLVADCGAVCTKVSLFGLVEGQYRLMARGEAPTTIVPPQEDITEGIIQAIRVIEFITGRRFVSDGHILSPEQPTGDGVDIFIATVSAGEPIRMAVLGAVTSELETLAAQAVSGLYAETYAIPSPSFLATKTSLSASKVPGMVAVGAWEGLPSTPNGTSEPWTKERTAMEWEQQLIRIKELQPHAVLMVGQADGPTGSAPLQEACQLLINTSGQQNEQYGANSSSGGVPQYTATHQIPVLYAAAPQYVQAVQRMLHGVAHVTPVNTLATQEQLGSINVAMGTLHERNIIQRLPGYKRLNTWSSTKTVATATSLSSLVRFLAQHYSMSVTAVDVGGMTTTVMVTRENGEFTPKVNPGLGIGQGMGSILQQAGFKRIARWLPFTVTEDEMRQFVLDHMLNPHIAPTTPRELQLCQAFAREAIILTVQAAQKNDFEWLNADLILATGGIFAHAPRFGQVAAMLLDTLQPRGVTSLVLDRAMVISQLGAVATVAPIAAVQVNENDAVTYRLGTCLIPFGTIQPGQPAVRVGLEHRNGRKIEVTVMGGTIEVIPLQMNEQALLTISPAPTVDVGLGPGERARAAEEIDGGLVGLIVDARGRPLVLPDAEEERQARLLQWHQALSM
ncbi:MAG: glutamate mutase L [Ktedonobacteraceae bacterium]|nr:glutamate mutase L [Ktedonobacteraceae bacterium]